MVGVRQLGIVGAAALLYFLIPVDAAGGGHLIVLAIGFVLALAALAGLVTFELRRALAASSGEVRLRILLLLLYAVVLLFSLSYWALDRADPAAFVDLSSRTDALYFTIATLGTVGFGDVHAASTAARGAVTVQMVFDLTYIAVIIRLLSIGVGHRSAPPPQPPTDAS